MCDNIFQFILYISVNQKKKKIEKKIANVMNSSENKTSIEILILIFIRSPKCNNLYFLLKI